MPEEDVLDDILQPGVGTHELNRVYKYIGSVVGNLIADSVPNEAVWPHINVADPTPWKGSPGPLTDQVGKLRSLIRPLRCDKGRAIEGQYLKKFRPRNTRFGLPVQTKLKSMQFSVPKPSSFELTSEMVKNILYSVGFDAKFEYDPSQVFSITAPRSQSNSGITWDMLREEFVTGKKRDVWVDIQNITFHFLRDIFPTDFKMLKWEHFGPELSRFVIKILKLVFLLLLRVDGNPEKPRFIWSGQSFMYILESMIFLPFRQWAKTCDLFAFKSSITLGRLKKFEGGNFNFLSSDISNWDLSQYEGSQIAVWRALMELMDVPEELGVLCAIYNIYAPLIIPRSHEDRVNVVSPYYTHKGFVAEARERRGMQPSGSGAFVWTNHILNLSYQVYTSLAVHDPVQYRRNWEHAIDWPYGQVYGDDTWWPVNCTAKQWQTTLQKQFGISMKVEESILSPKMVLMLRRIVQIGDDTIEPVIASRVRNMICPSYFDVSAVTEWEKCVIFRAQSVEIYLAMLETRTVGYWDLIRYLQDEIVPIKMLKPGLTDKEVVSRLPTYSHARDSLDWVKRTRGIEETSDIFSQV